MTCGRDPEAIADLHRQCIEYKVKKLQIERQASAKADAIVSEFREAIYEI